MATKKLTKKELKQPDQFVGFWQIASARVGRFAAENAQGPGDRHQRARDGCRRHGRPEQCPRRAARASAALERVQQIAGAELATPRAARMKTDNIPRFADREGAPGRGPGGPGRALRGRRTGRWPTRRRWCAAGCCSISAAPMRPGRLREAPGGPARRAAEVPGPRGPRVRPGTKGQARGGAGHVREAGDRRGEPGRLLQGSGPLPRGAAGRAARQPGGGHADLQRGAGKEPDHLVARRDLESSRAARAEVTRRAAVRSRCALARCRRGGRMRLRHREAPGRFGRAAAPRRASCRSPGGRRCTITACSSRRPRSARPACMAQGRLVIGSRAGAVVGVAPQPATSTG